MEGVSAGARIASELGRVTLSAEARLGHADLEPRGELALSTAGDGLAARFAAYRRLDAASPTPSPHGTFTSLRALLFGSNDTEFYDAFGVELVLAPPEIRAQRYDLRLYAERQRAVERNTDFSVRRLLDSDHVFRANFAADAADQVGARLRLRAGAGLAPAAPHVAAEVALAGEAGDYDIFRPEALLRLGTALPRGLELGVEGAAGTVEGTAVPAQALWRLGGVSSLRGFREGALVGERYWRARAEVGLNVLGLRVIPFTDAAWVGPRSRFDVRGVQQSVGVGFSFGLFRIDVARPLVSGGRVRLHLQFNGVL